MSRTTAPWLPDRYIRLTRLLLVAAVFTVVSAAHAQGCAQCLDSTRATPPQVQTAYRHAIYLLGGTGAVLFLIGALVIRRER